MSDERGSQWVQLMTPWQASNEIGVTVGTLANWRLKGIGPCYIKLSKNGRIRYPFADLQAYINSRPRFVPSVEKHVQEAYVG